MLNEKVRSFDNVNVGASTQTKDVIHWKPVWTIEKYNKSGELYAVEKFDGNLLLNEGIALLLSLLTGGAGTAYNNANARIGVGDSTTAAAAAQTALQASTNKTWVAMDATYPLITNQTVTFKATFGSAVANYAWQEYTVVNAANDSGVNLNRKVESHGTKASGDTWVIQLAITIS